MDNQGLEFFEKISYEDLTPEDAKWLVKFPSLGKREFRSLPQKFSSGEFTLWKVKPPGEGLAITYPDSGLLFVYYLHGRGLFGRLNKEILLDLASSEGLEGLRTEVGTESRVRLFKKFGWSPVFQGDAGWILEIV